MHRTSLPTTALGVTFVKPMMKKRLHDWGTGGKRRWKHPGLWLHGHNLCPVNARWLPKLLVTTAPAALS